MGLWFSSGSNGGTAMGQEDAKGKPYPCSLPRDSRKEEKERKVRGKPSIPAKEFPPWLQDHLQSWCW